MKKTTFTQSMKFIIALQALILGFTTKAVSQTITVPTPALQSFNACAGSNSGIQQFSVFGNSLTADITVTAPTGFEISSPTATAFTNTVTLTTFPVIRTVVYVRLATTATGAPTGNVSLVSSTTSQNVAVSGNAYVATINPITGISACNGATVLSVPISGSLGNTYAWTNSNTAIGLAGSGTTSTIPSFTATNAGASPITGTVSITPTLNYNNSISQVFAFTGAVQTFTVPAGVTSLNVAAYGASGAASIPTAATPFGLPGAGSRAYGTIAVTPGQVIFIYVGGQAIGATGGFNGGGNGSSLGAAGFGGGGATDIRLGGTALTDRVLVAGGGGGGGRFGLVDISDGIPIVSTAGGNGGDGDTNGAKGLDTPTSGGVAGGGFGGISTTGIGGLKGIGCSGFLGIDGANGGTNGLGGNGGNGQTCCATTSPNGGGGGGGYLGGGGGGGGSAGTVGCSGNAKGAGGGGAGGTSYFAGAGVTNGNSFAGVATLGDGSVVITYAVAATCTNTASTFTYTINPSPPTTFTPAAGTLTSAIVGAAYSQTVTQVGLTGTLTWSVTPALPGGLSINTTNGTISGTPTGISTAASYIVRASDGNCSNTVTYSLAVVCPTLVFGTTTASGATVGTPYSLNAGVTGNTATVVYSILPALPAGLSIASASGLISGTPTAPASSTTYTVTATQGTCTATQAYTFAVACVGIAINPTSLINGVVGTAYSQTPTQTGLTGTPVWSVTGTLPNGLTIASATGIISGTPTTAGTFPFVVNVTDGSCSQTRNYSVVIACPTLVFGVTSTTGATIGTAFSLNAGVTGNTAAVVYSVLPALPGTLSISSSTGLISGTPTAVAASATYTVTATQGTCTVTQAYTFAVVCPTLVFGVTSTAGATIGSAFSLNAGVTGNTATVVYSVLPALPAGLSIASASGLISGTPTVPTASATYTVTATQGTCTATQAYTFAVACVGIAINPTSLINGVVGTAYSQTPIQTGLTGTPVWSVTGALPNGLTIASATGIISGTPTTAGTFPFVVNVTDGSCSQTRNYSVVIACPSIVFTNTTATNAVIGIAYTFNAGATGNTAALTYSVSPALPAGLNLDISSGVISGTSTALVVPAAYVVTARQTVDCANTQSYTFGVIPACSPVILGLASIPNATIGTPYSQTFTATGGTAGATYTFTTTSPQLALNGLSLSPAGVLSGTPTFSTSITFRVTATTTPNGCTGFKDYTFVINPNPATSVDNSLASSVKVSPNPSNSDFNVDFGTINMAKSSVSVYDMQGKVVFTSENNSNLRTISLDKFANGIYLLEVKTENGRITKRLSKTN